MGLRRSLRQVRTRLANLIDPDGFNGRVRDRLEKHLVEVETGQRQISAAVSDLGGAVGRLTAEGDVVSEIARLDARLSADTDIIKRLLTYQAVRTTLQDVGVWFVDIPRTSSSSLRVELGRAHGPVYQKSDILEHEMGGPQFVDVHRTAAEMQNLIGARLWESILTFTVIRNPWDRVHSLYHYLRHVGVVPADMTFAECMRQLESSDGTEPMFRHRFVWAPMSEYLLDSDGTCLVREVIRFENRAEGLARIGEQIGLPGLGDLHLQRAVEKGYDFRESYDAETRERVARIYARDIESFGYEF